MVDVNNGFEIENISAESHKLKIYPFSNAVELEKTNNFSLKHTQQKVLLHPSALLPL